MFWTGSVCYALFNVHGASVSPCAVIISDHGAALLFIVVVLPVFFISFLSFRIHSNIILPDIILLDYPAYWAANPVTCIIATL